MKGLLIFLVVLTVIATVRSKDDRLLEEWKSFKKTYNKVYSNIHTEKSKMSVWVKNYMLIVKHNEEAEHGQHTFKLKMNQFGDLTSREFAKLVKRTINLPRRNASGSQQYFENQEIPSEVDWRTKGCVLPVRSESIMCFDDWAFGVTESLAGITCVKNGNLTELSAQQLVDCSQSFGNKGCADGNFENSYKYIVQNKGLDTALSYPYTDQEGQCMFNPKNVACTLSGFREVISQNETDLTIALATVGPIPVLIDAGQSSFQFYSSGVYYEPNCSTTDLDHVLVLVGYGTQDSDTSGNQDYYIGKNSWSLNWGDKGYILMSRNRSNNCGIATYASYGLVV